MPRRGWGRLCPQGRSSSSGRGIRRTATRSEEHTSELQSQSNLVCRLLLEKKNEHIFVYMKEEPVVQAIRQMFDNPNFSKNLENAVKRIPRIQTHLPQSRSVSSSFASMRDK